MNYSTGSIVKLIFSLKLLCGFFYFYYYEDFGFDYLDLFKAYCNADIITDFEVIYILDKFHEAIFKQFCFLGKNYFFWIFFIIQLFFYITIFKKIYNYYKDDSRARWLIIALFASPTLALFSSSPTKDGFFILLIFLVIFFLKYLPKFFIILPCVVKPYFLLLYSSFSKFWILILFTNMIIYFYDSSIYNDVGFIISKKISVSTFQSLSKIGLVDTVWLLELFIILFLSSVSKHINKFALLFLLIITIVGVGYNFNVGSRILSLGILLLLSTNYVYKK
tara:strand:- start:392 stop:1225 length:834 start_codon:yes stop_codon:yes gene_type:complete